MSVHPLLEEQRRAADPSVSAWVSASAGTGKTQVLTARVLRLLLAGAAPDRLLALTFTKAAAAVMQTRIFETLSSWVRAADDVLAADLIAIGATPETATKLKARTLFAAALEVRGGFKVQTLHSFAATVLSAFPIEAGIAPGYETLDDRSAIRMRADVLARRVAFASKADPAFLADLATLSVKSGESGTQEAIAKLLAKRSVFESHYGKRVDWRASVRRALGIPGIGDRTEILSAALADDAFDWATVREYAAAMASWGTKTGLSAADTLSRTLAAKSSERALLLNDLLLVGLKQDGTPRADQAKLGGLHDRLCAILFALGDLARSLDLAETAAVYLRVGHALAEGYAEAKSMAGTLDYDDLIAKAAELLTAVDAGYVLYKLDQRIEHVLVDEGQDTNADQWAIINAIADEFFAGEGTRDESETGPRTQFAVGDYKQAIFGFQGTNPEEFDRARGQAETRAGAAGKPFKAVDLSVSFRSVPAVLDVVDKVVELAGAAAFGLSGAIPAHRPHRTGQAGEVVLWPPIVGDSDDADDNEPENGSPAWVQPNEIILADRIAAQIASWVKSGDMLAAHGRPVKAGDILILVRSRKELVPALVSALIKNGVEVAGADRLKLMAPLAVQDLLALARFALQPGDDLALASVLVSPLIGWSQEQLYAAAYKRPTTLWRAVRDAKDKGDAAAIAAEDWLGKVLALAGYLAPYEFFERILSSELAARARLLARLGEEARDPIEEVLNQALAYEAANTPSLQGFLAWVETDEVDVKREAESPRDAVRIMTVHGAKGLQAPIVILADAASAVPKSVKPPLTMPLPGIGNAPIFFASKQQVCGPAATALAAAERAEAEETMRLLYVAMTRAEDRLYVGGALGKRARSGQSWHDHVGDALDALGTEAVDDRLWGGKVRRHATGLLAKAAHVSQKARPPAALPDWVRRAAPADERPPRPLAPSSGLLDDFAAPPPTPAMLAAARRGQVLHLIFERMGSVDAPAREDAVRRWLARNAADVDADQVTQEVLRVVADTAFADFFGGEALAEAPLSAIVGDNVITGTIDRLVVGPNRVRALDFKTGHRVPASAADVPAYHARQMAAYRDALGVIFPGRRIETLLLYTSGPRLIVLD